MPTGYTSKIKDGISFEEYARDCAKAFIRDETYCNYYQEELEKFKLELKDVLKLTPEELEEKAQHKYDCAVEYNKKSIIDQDILMSEYKDMLEKVRNYESPSTKHDEFKNFMMSQIEESMKFDCMGDFYKKELSKCKKLSWEEYLEKTINELTSRIESLKIGVREERERNEDKKDWILKLNKSLG